MFFLSDNQNITVIVKLRVTWVEVDERPTRCGRLHSFCSLLTLPAALRLVDVSRYTRRVTVIDCEAD